VSPQSDRHDVGETKAGRITREAESDAVVEAIADDVEETTAKEAKRVRGRTRRDLILVSAFLLLVVAGVLWQGHELRQDSIEGCERQNEVRVYSGHTADILRNLVAVSLEAGGDEGGPPPTKAEREARAIFEQAVENLTPLALTDCEAEY
jgi:hypothetical protein